MSQQAVSTVKGAGDGIPLVAFHMDLRVHAYKIDVLPVIFTGTHGIEHLVVSSAQVSPPFRILEYPVLERFFHGLLLLLGDCRFFLVQHADLLAVRVIMSVEDLDTPLV